MKPAGKMLWKVCKRKSESSRTTEDISSGQSMLVSALTAKLMVYRGRKVDLESGHRTGRQYWVLD